MCRGIASITKRNRLVSRWVKQQNESHLNGSCCRAQQLSVILEEKEENLADNCEAMAERLGHSNDSTALTQQRNYSGSSSTRRVAIANHNTTLKPDRCLLSPSTRQRRKEKDLNAMRAAFPDFFPQSLAPVSYVAGQQANALEEMFRRQNLKMAANARPADKENILNWYITEYGLTTRTAR